MKVKAVVPGTGTLKVNCSIMSPTTYTRSNGGNPSPGTGQSSSTISQSSRILGAPLHLDFDQVDTSSTYAALSSCVKLLEAAGRRQPNFVSRPELDLIIQEFEARVVDLSDILGFPYGADDLEDCLFLLARLQNRMAMRGIQYTSCTLREILADALVDRSTKSHRYDIGEWVEVRGPSMKYRLERIIDVVRTSDNEFFYETSVDHKLKEVQLRWPRESLIRIFGVAPWVWRQWACLKLENKLRFQEGNPYDFEILDIRAYALELWELWLADQRNEAFRQLFERVGSSGQEELIHHIIAPFNLMHEVVTNDDGQWDLDAAVTSMFTYMSLLGTGFVDAFIVFLLQVTIPIILFFYYTSPAREDDEIHVGTRGMLFAVLVYYMYKLNRDLWTNFINVAGTSEDTASRIRSLRRITWEEGNDSFLQSLGASVDLFMNTGYICILYMFNVWILYNVSDPFELLGSLIFFDFLFNLDEEIAQSSWWDGNKRLLRAGIVSIILQNTIRRSTLVDAETYLQEIGKTLTRVDVEIVRHQFHVSGIPQDRDFLHGTETEEGRLLTVTERVDRLRGIESMNALATDTRENSSTTESIFSKLWQDRSEIFNRHKDMRAWSQWEMVLFAFPTPNLVPQDYIPGKRIVVPDDMADHTVVQSKRRFASSQSNQVGFLRHAMDVLTCRQVSHSFQTGSEKNTWWFKFTRGLHAVASWSSYFLQLVFPIFSFVALACVFTEYYCYFHLSNCTLPKQSW